MNLSNKLFLRESFNVFIRVNKNVKFDQNIFICKIKFFRILTIKNIP